MRLNFIKASNRVYRVANLSLMIFVACVSESLVYTAKSDSLIDRALHPGASTSAKIITVHFGNIIYDIPRNYLAGVTQPSETNPYAAFTLQVLLPDFIPRTTENAAQFDHEGWGDKLRALFEYGRHPKSSEEILDFYLHISKTNKEDFRIVGSGYKFFERLNNVPHEIYTKETASGMMLFTCENQKYHSTPISPDCTVNEYFGDDIGVIYHFDRKYLDRAVSIDLRLHDLLASFKRK